MKVTNMDLLTIAVLTLLIQPLIFGLTVEPARVAFGLLLVLFFPGYALVSALYPRRQQLTGIQRIALGLGLSIALVPLLGLALNFTPWGIRLIPIVVTLSLWTLTVLAVSWIQRQRIPPEERFEVPWANIVAWVRRQRRLVDLTAGLVLSISVLLVIGGVAWKIQQPVHEESFTEFFILGAQKMLQDYPTKLRAGEAQDYNVGIVNHEGETATYIIRASLSNADVGSLGPLILEDEEAWEGKINVRPDTVGDQQKLEFRLYRNPSNESYRSLHLFVDVRGQ